MLSPGSTVDPHRIFSKFELAPRSAAIAAVSGGSDSLALLFLLHAFLSDKAPATRLIAVTVDHGLRPESAAEAERVAEICRAEGIAHRTMGWTGAKPGHRLQATAREARYRLLAEAADSEGTDLVLTGHTLDDQIETVAMRSARGDGRGLAGMAPATFYDGRVWIVRSLLGTRRVDLRAYLVDRDIRWIDDPSNVDRKYERVRLRLEGQRSATTLAPPSPRPELVEGSRGEGEGEGRSGAQAAELVQSEIAAAAAGRVSLGGAAAELIDAYARLASPGLVALDRAFTEAAGRQAAIYALRILLATLGGAEQLPELDRAAALLDQLGDPRRATLSRTIVDVRRAGIFLCRERRGLPEPMTVHGRMIWDGRYRIEADIDLVHMLVAPFGMENAREAELSGADAPGSLVRAALACEPAVYVSRKSKDARTPPGHAALGRGAASWDLAPVLSLRERRVAEPGKANGESGESTAANRDVSALIRIRIVPLVAPWARFLPSFDLAPCRAVAELIGATGPPAPPFAGHKGGEG